MRLVTVGGVSRIRFKFERPSSNSLPISLSMSTARSIRFIGRGNVAVESPLDLRCVGSCRLGGHVSIAFRLNGSLNRSSVSILSPSTTFLISCSPEPTSAFSLFHAETNPG